MKVTNTYYRFKADNTFGIVASRLPKMIYVNMPSAKRGGTVYCVTGAGESVIVWNVKTGLSDSSIHILDLVSGTGSRLNGHRGIVHCLTLINNDQILISGAQDKFVKLWDLANNHCFATLTGHPGPVWDLTVSPDASLLVSGSNDALLRVWKLEYCDRQQTPVISIDKSLARRITTSSSDPGQSTSLDDDHKPIQADFLGTIPRTSTSRAHTVKFDGSGKFLVCQAFERTVEFFHVLDEEAQAKRLRKKIKKAKQKQESSDDQSPPQDVQLTIADVIRSFVRVDLGKKVVSCDLAMARLAPNHRRSSTNHKRPTLLKFICSLVDNSFIEHELVIPPDEAYRPQFIRPMSSDQFDDQESSSRTLLVRPTTRQSVGGHRSSPFACQLTDDLAGIVTVSRSEAKLWNRRTSACLATVNWTSSSIDPDDQSRRQGDDQSKQASPLPTKASAMVLLPGGRHVVIGFDTGELYLFDIGAKHVSHKLSNVHNGAVRALVLTSNKKGIVSGGSDSIVTFYDFNLRKDGSRPTSLYLVESQSPKGVADQITCLAGSPNGLLYAIGLVNFHVDIHYADSFKRFHSLYGHAGPVSTLDISPDSRLILTGSSDKTIRLWELQFGNCQRRFTSHVDAITCVRFVPNSRFAFSSDQGGAIKQWDIKKMQEVVSLKGHDGSVTCLATGSTLATVKTNEPVASTKRPDHKNKKHRRGGPSPEDDLDDDPDEILTGGLVASCGFDFSIRLYAESDELLVAEEEQELEREAVEDEDELVRSEAVVPGAIPSDVSETGLLGKPTTRTRDAADMLMDAIDLCEQEEAKLISSKSTADRKPQDLHPLIVARGAESPDQFLLTSLSRLRLPSSSSGCGLEHVLGSLTQRHVAALLPRLINWLSQGGSSNLELIGRSLRHLVTLHPGLVVGMTGKLLAKSRQGHHQSEVSQVKRLLGINLAGLDYLSRKIGQDQFVAYTDALDQRGKRQAKQKAKRARMALLIPG